MANIIIILILLVIVVLALKSASKHFRGEGGCCGGSSDKPLKKKLDHVVETYIIHIEGMHCQNCSNAIMRGINRIDGASAEVYLKRKMAKISCDRPMDEDTFKRCIEGLGYSVTKIDHV